MEELKSKRFPVDSVVYYVQKRGYAWDWKVHYGIVKDIFMDGLCVTLYDSCDKRIINGVPIKDLVTPTRWKKLPKGWKANKNSTSELLKITYSDYPEKTKGKKYDPRNPDDILAAIEDGLLVKVETKDYAQIQVEIKNGLGWRLIRHIKRYPHPPIPPIHVSLKYHEAYKTYEEAEQYINDYKSKLEAEANMSDYDWSVKEIDKTLDFWASLNGVSDLEKKEYRDYILSLENVEDIEISVQQNNRICWKYWNKKRWMAIELDSFGRNVA